MINLEIFLILLFFLKEFYAIDIDESIFSLITVLQMKKVRQRNQTSL